MRSHREILAKALKARQLSHVKIAKVMGWSSPATVGHKLRGRNDWNAGELERMCELAGMTLIMLSEQSDDFKLAKRKTSIEGASILDDLPEDELEFAMTMLRAYKKKNLNGSRS